MGHVPAWKRIGLNLKFAKEEPKSLQLQEIGEEQLSKHISSKQNPEQDQPVKRRRLAESNAKNDTKVFLDGAEILPSLKRKKSVSFTDDTKTEDGDSRITIDFPVNASEPTPERFKSKGGQPLDTDAEPKHRVASGIEPKTKQKKQKTSGGSNQIQKIRKSEDSLDYIVQHYSNRSQWKFNKNRDIWIMKNALSTDSIPSSLNRALAGYVHGLPKNAGARYRLIEQSREALSDESPVSNNDSLLHKFLDDLDGKSVATKNPELYAWVNELSRPRLLLHSLNVKIDQTPSALTTVTDRGSVSKGKSPNIRKRKARTTAAVEFSSSSESESEESSNTSLSSDKADDVGQSRRNKQGNLANRDSSPSSSTKDSVSSSEETSSSSESDSK